MRSSSPPPTPHHPPSARNQTAYITKPNPFYSPHLSHPITSSQSHSLVQPHLPRTFPPLPFPPPHNLPLSSLPTSSSPTFSSLHASRCLSNHNLSSTIHSAAHRHPLPVSTTFHAVHAFQHPAYSRSETCDPRHQTLELYIEAAVDKGPASRRHW